MGTTETKVIIGMPVNGKMEQMTTGCIANAIIGANGLVKDFILRVGCDIVSSRTWIVREARKKGATHLLFVDSDMFFPADTIPRLLAHDKDIIGVQYNRRRFPLEGTSEPLTEISLSAIEPYKAKYCGTGLMLIKLSIFDEPWKDYQGKPQPWFSFARDSEGMLKLGEDAWFCFSARDMGFDTWIDPTIKIGHIGTYQY